MSNYYHYAPVRRVIEGGYGEMETTHFNYLTVDFSNHTLYVDEQTSTVVLDPFKWEKEVIGG